MKRAATALVLVLAAASSCAAGCDDCALFAAAQPPLQADGTSQRIALPGNGAVELRSVRFTPKPGQSEAINTTWCGVVLQAPDWPPQGVVTIGTGDTEALSCRGLAEAGAVPASGKAPRIGLIYRTSSPNAAVVTPVVLVRNPATAAWSIDTAATARLDESETTMTLARMRRELGGR